MTYHILTGSVVRLLAALGIAGGVLPGSESRPIGHDEAAEYTQDTMLQRPECGGIEDTTHHNNIPLSDSIASIPEFHDCQRFIHGGGYIARYAIFVAFKLDSLVATLDPDTSGFGRLYEQRSPDTSDPRLVADPTTQTILVRTRGVGVATIYNFGSVYYQPLGIHPGFSCLYLFRDPAGGQWRALMVPNGPTNPYCAMGVSPDTLDGKELMVRTLSPLGFRDEAYPPVARWDWDPEAHEQYIGIKCGQAWCEVGDSGFVSSQGYATLQEWEGGAALTLAQHLQVNRIKGWYDEERLAVLSPNGGLHPGSVWGVVFPHPVLGMLTVDAFGDWRHVANAVLEGTTPPYGRYKLNFAEGTNRIYLCRQNRDGPDNCRIPTRWEPRRGAEPCDTSADGHRWWAKIVSAGPRPVTEFRCVKRRPHPGNLNIPGAARWRWKETDQTVWVRCDKGCCELQ